jgi:hypothetical protein
MDSLSQQLADGQLTAATAMVFLGIALVLSVAGGAAAGIALAGKDLGHQLAALMGGMFGPTAVLPAAVIGLVVLRLI